MEDKKHQLFERLDKNLADYHVGLMGLERKEIIGMAARVAAMSDVHGYMTNQYAFDESQLAYLLRFRNPLEVVTDAWDVQRGDIADLDFIIHGVCDRREALLLDYARVGEDGEPIQIESATPYGKADAANMTPYDILMERTHKNFEDFKNQQLQLGKEEIFSNAGEISNIINAIWYIQDTLNRPSPRQIDHLAEI